MTLTELCSTLDAHPSSGLTFLLPDSQEVPAHFHITEVAKREKTFVDCGGTNRHTETCALQLWVARDVDHRLTAGKLRKIIDHADGFFSDKDIPVEIDHQLGSLTIFTLDQVESKNDNLVFHLAPVEAACLAPDKCGITPELMPLPSIGIQSTPNCTPGSGCC